MLDIIKDMIITADENHDYQLIEYVKRIINEFVGTVNCPSNWRTIVLSLSTKYTKNTWVYEQLELWSYEE